MSRLRHLWPVLILALLALVPLWRCVFLGETIGAWDEVGQMAPWHHTSNAPWDVLQADSVLEFYGWRDQVFKAWGSNHIPLWNHNELGGSPLLANSQSGGFYPPHILVGLAHIPTGPALTLLAWLHLVLAGLGVFLLCRRLGATKAGALIGGAAFALSPFMVSWIALPSVVETVTWIPWGLFGVLLLPGRRGILALAISGTMMITAGHLQFATYGFIAWFIAVLVRVLTQSPERGKVALTAALSMLMVGMLSAPHLLPVLAHGKYSHRQVAPTADGYAGYAAGALPWWEALSFPDADALGLPTQAIEVQGGKLVSFWPAFVARGSNFAESAIGVGWVVTVLLVFGLTWRKIRLAKEIALIGLVGLLLAFGTPLLMVLYYGVPGWAATGSPGRAGVLVVLAVCVLAGLAGSNEFFSEPRSRRFLVFLVPVLAIILLLAIPFGSSDSGDVSTLVSAAKANNFPLLIAGLLAGCVAVGLRRRLPWTYPALPVIVIAALPGLFLVRSGMPKLDHVLKASEQDRVAIVNSKWDLLTAADALYPPNTAALNGIHELGGYDSIVDVRTRDELAAIDGKDPAPAANGNMMFVKPTFNPDLLAEAGATEVWSLTPLAQLSTEPTIDHGVYRYKLPGRGRAFMDNGPATIMREGPDFIEVEAHGPGQLWLKDRLHEGWRAFVDEVPTPMNVDPWPHLPVGAGRYTVRFEYWPDGLGQGLIIFVIGLIGVCALLIVPIRKMTATAQEPVPSPEKAVVE
jgi:hypothetical protein